MENLRNAKKNLKFLESAPRSEPKHDSVARTETNHVSLSKADGRIKREDHFRDRLNLAENIRDGADSDANKPRLSYDEALKAATHGR